MGQQTKKTDKVSKSDKISKSDKHAMFLKKAEKIANEFVSVFDDATIKGPDKPRYYIISIEHFGLSRMNSLNKLCKKNKVTYFCMYNTYDKTFDFYLHDTK